MSRDEQTQRLVRMQKRAELVTMVRTLGRLAANEHASDAEHDAAMAAVEAVQKLIDTWDAAAQLPTFERREVFKRGAK